MPYFINDPSKIENPELVLSEKKNSSSELTIEERLNKIEAYLTLDQFTQAEREIHAIQSSLKEVKTVDYYKFTFLEAALAIEKDHYQIAVIKFEFLINELKDDNELPEKNLILALAYWKCAGCFYTQGIEFNKAKEYQQKAARLTERFYQKTTEQQLSYSWDDLFFTIIGDERALSNELKKSLEPFRNKILKRVTFEDNSPTKNHFIGKCYILYLFEEYYEWSKKPAENKWQTINIISDIIPKVENFIKNKQPSSIINNAYELLVKARREFFYYQSAFENLTVNEKQKLKENYLKDAITSKKIAILVYGETAFIVSIMSNNLAVCYSTLERFSDALKEITSAIDIYKKHLGKKSLALARKYVNSSFFYMNAGQLDEAKNILTQIIDNILSNPELKSDYNKQQDLGHAYYFLSRVCLKQNDILSAKDAIKSYENQLLNLSEPEQTGAKVALCIRRAHILIKSNELEAAKEQLDMVAENIHISDPSFSSKYYATYAAYSRACAQKEISYQTQGSVNNNDQSQRIQRLYNDAIEYLKNSLKILPSDKTFYKLGKYLLESNSTGSLNDAEENFRKATYLPKAKLAADLLTVKKNLNGEKIHYNKLGLTTLLEYLIFCSSVSDIKDGKNNDKLEELLNSNQGWRKFKTVKDFDIQIDEFFGASFMHVERKELVIAFKGTDPFSAGDIATDWKLWKARPNDHFMRAIIFCQKLLTSFKKDTPDYQTWRIRFTGHSLGGAFAFVTLFFLMCTDHYGPELKGFKSNSHGIGFDAAGVADLIAFMLRRELTPSEIQILRERMVNYMGDPNPPNAAMGQIGTLFQIHMIEKPDAQIDNSFFRAAWGKFTDWVVPQNAIESIKRFSMQHTIQYFLKYFDNETGFFKVGTQISQVHSWPHGLEELFNYFDIERKNVKLQTSVEHEVNDLNLNYLVHYKVVPLKIDSFKRISREQFKGNSWTDLKKLMSEKPDAHYTIKYILDQKGTTNFIDLLLWNLCVIDDNQLVSPVIWAPDLLILFLQRFNSTSSVAGSNTVLNVAERTLTSPKPTRKRGAEVLDNTLDSASLSFN